MVERECAVCELLRKRGIPLPYRAWGDYTRTVVPRSVFVCEELQGLPVPEALRQFPGEREAILNNLGRYMRQLHDIEFSRPGLLAYAHAYFAAAHGTIPSVFTWDRHPMHHAEYLQRDALDLLDTKKGYLPEAVTGALRELFSSLAAVVRSDYSPPRFTVGNCHAWHFHVSRHNGEWRIEGFYDLEAASAGDSNIDLVELEMTLTPALRSTAWREPFFAGYGSWPGFDGYKRRLLYYLLFEVGKAQSPMIPDADWLSQRWSGMIHAVDWSQLGWYPQHMKEAT